MGAFQKGEQGAVVEVSSMPYEAYNIEVVTDKGQTLGLVEGVRPEQIDVPVKVRFSSISLEEDGTRAALGFSDGTEVTVGAQELYARKGCYTNSVATLTTCSRVDLTSPALHIPPPNTAPYGNVI
jgi:hypothetical protein